MKNSWRDTFMPEEEPKIIMDDVEIVTLRRGTYDGMVEKIRQLEQESNVYKDLVRRLNIPESHLPYMKNIKHLGVGRMDFNDREFMINYTIDLNDLKDLEEEEMYGRKM